MYDFSIKIQTLQFLLSYQLISFHRTSQLFYFLHFIQIRSAKEPLTKQFW